MEDYVPTPTKARHSFKVRSKKAGNITLLGKAHIPSHGPRDLVTKQEAIFIMSSSGQVGTPVGV